MSNKKQSRKEKRIAERKLKKSISKTSPTKSNKKESTVWLYGLVAILVTFICFSNVGGLDFVNWDDDRNTYENVNVMNFSMEEFGKHTKTSKR